MNPPKRRRKTETEYTRMAKAREAWVAKDTCIPPSASAEAMSGFYAGWYAALRSIAARKRGRS